MHPDLFHIGPLTVHSYGTLIVIGFLMGLALIRYRANQYNTPYEKIVDLAFGLLITGFIGAKLFHWLIIPSGFIRDMSLLFSDPLAFAKNLGNGFEFFGGIAVGVVFFVWYCRKHGLDHLKVLDLITPAVPLAHAFGRLGCFMAGCCYGKTCELPWAVTFNDPHSLARPLGVPLHPTQLYESLLLFVLTAVLLGNEHRIVRIKGRMISAYILGYTVIRFAVEFFRGDDRGTIKAINMTGTQIIALCIAAGAIIWLIRLNRLNREATSAQNNNHS